MENWLAQVMGTHLCVLHTEGPLQIIIFGNCFGERQFVPTVIFTAPFLFFFITSNHRPSEKEREKIIDNKIMNKFVTEQFRFRK